MKRSLKTVLGIVGLIILCILVDLTSIFIFKRPIFALKGSVPYMYKGILYDTYTCPYQAVRIKAKGTKFTCQVKEQNNYTIETVESKNCDNKAKLYTRLNNVNIYTYCLDSILINDNKNKVELKDYLKEHETIIEEIINKLSIIDVDSYGGSKLYKSNTFTLLKCNNLDNKDIYIGFKEMNYEDNFCKFDKSFIRTYKVLNIEKSNDDTYLYLTLRAFQDEDVETVKVNKSLINDIEEDKYYEFKFQKDNYDIEDNIKSIFENKTLISIDETKKEGLEQIQENIN